MLVLTRRGNQSIMIGPDIVITVLEVSRDQVRIGIQAPRHVDVHREEVFAEVQRANRDAASSGRRNLDQLGQLKPPSAPKIPPPPPQAPKGGPS